MSHFLSMEENIVGRLAATLPTDVRAITAADMASVKAGVSGAVFVLFNGYRPGRLAGAIQEIEQEWLTVVSVRNLKTLSADGARADAGPIITAVIEALLNHTFTGYRPLRLSAGAAPMHEGGMAYYPVAWNTSVRVQGQCD